MKAIILAAGRGSRLGNLTEGRPKCLVELGGAPLLDWQLAALRQGGINDIIIVGGYKSEQLRRPGTHLVVNPDWATTNMLRSLLCARDAIDGPLVVSYSDIVYTPETVRALAEKSAELAISYDPDWLTLWKQRFYDPLDDAETFRIDGSGRIQEIGGKPDAVEHIQGQYMGLIRLSPAALGWIDAELASIKDGGSTLAMTQLMMRLVGKGCPIYAVPVCGSWCEIDSQGDLAVAEELLARRQLGWKGGPAW